LHGTKNQTGNGTGRVEKISGFRTREPGGPGQVHWPEQKRAKTTTLPSEGKGVADQGTGDHRGVPKTLLKSGR